MRKSSRKPKRSKRMFKPCKQDPLKNRRTLAIIAFLNALAFPYVIVALHVSDALGSSLLTFMTALTTVPVGGYLFAAHRKDHPHVSDNH